MQTAQGHSGYAELRQNWRVLLPCWAGITLCATHGYALGVTIVPIEQEFGWARAQISGGLMIIALMSLVGAPLIGTLVDRIGPRRIGLFGVVFYCSALALLSTASGDVRSWWLLWAVVGIGSMCILPTLWTKAINMWFDRNRGLALALALCGTGVTASIVPPLTHFLVSEYGWRGAYIGLGVIGLVFTLPLVVVFFPAGGPAGVMKEDGTSAPDELHGFSARQGYSKPSFLKLAIALGLFSTSICAFTTNAVPVLLAQGLTAAVAASVAGLLGIGSITGRLVGGFLLDRFDAAKVAAISVSLPIFAVLLLMATPGSVLTAAIAWFVVGLSVGTEVDCAAYLAARHFGLKSFGALFGTMNGLMLFGAGIAPVLGNLIYDLTKSYDIMLWAQIPACLITAVLFLMLGPYPRFVRDGEDAVEPITAPSPA